MDSDNKDQTIFNGFGQQGSIFNGFVQYGEDHVMNLDSKDKTI